MIKKRDIMLAVLLIVIGVAMLICMRIFRKDGSYVEVYVDGKLVQRQKLSESGTYKIETSSGTNILIIEDGQAYVSEADCPDKLCTNMGCISKNGENIVCIPHKLVIQISGGEEKEYDVK